MTLSGIVTLVSSFVENAASSILMILLGIVTLVSFLFSNAEYPITVTGWPLIVSGITTSFTIPV